MSNPRQHSPSTEPAPGFHPSQHLDPLQHQADALNLYARFIRPGDLVFDIGANVGERTKIFLSLGARVVAVEPQKDQADHIPREATVIEAACGAETGEQLIYVNGQTPYMTTLSRRFIDQLESAPGVGGRLFDLPGKPCAIVTLDDLIAEYGVPAFCKIDVEGYEVEVLRGLNQRLPALSFEVHSFDTDKAEECVERLNWLADYGDTVYHYIYSPLETFRLEPWPPAELAMFGDVYATLAP